jgi:(p)ppGpp synthase/HD superfamily hydrolase
MSQGTTLTENFERAVSYALHAHEAQRRKGTPIPYAAHLLGVCALVLEGGGDEEQAVAALLHDAAEDQGGRERLEDIRARFGERVARIVDGCTDSYDQPKPPWRQRKDGYLARLQGEPAHVARVSLADKLNNIRAVVRDYRDIGDELWGRFNAGKDGQLWYFRARADAFAVMMADGRLARPMVGEFQLVVSDLERLVGAAGGS